MQHTNTTHNLNIQSYNFKDILHLFHLDYTISLDDIKNAKKKVLMMHPDKSKLPPEYFLFYKKAFDIVYNYYKDSNKQSQPVSSDPIQYTTNHSLNKSVVNVIKTSIDKMDKTEFQQKFNELFENNMSSKPNTQKNEWFSNNDPIYTEKANSVSHMGTVFDNIKSKNNSIIKHQSVADLYTTQGVAGANLYDDDDDETEHTYVSSDIFSRLKFDDLRKVHKDQTILAVSESDYKNMPHYSSVEKLNQSRASQTLTPLEKTHAEKMLVEQEMIFKQKMMNKQHDSNLKSMKYDELNKSVLATFLQIKNG